MPLVDGDVRVALHDAGDSAGLKQLFAGKPVLLGGSLGRTEATGRGVAYITERAPLARGTEPCISNRPSA